MESLAEIEMVHIKKVLDFCKWNITATARALGISKSTLYRYMEKYGIVKGDL